MHVNKKYKRCKMSIERFKKRKNILKIIPRIENLWVQWKCQIIKLNYELQRNKKIHFVGNSVLCKNEWFFW